MRNVCINGGIPLQEWKSTRRVETEPRAVSPVIGVVLMLAITVTLVAVVTPVIFTVTNSVGGSPPDTDLTFFYDESVGEDEQDSFNNDANDVDGDGLLTITFESGSAIPIEDLSIEGSEGGGELEVAETYEDGDKIRPGDEITVWVKRGENIDVVWDESGSSSSAILDRFDVPQLSS